MLLEFSVANFHSIKDRITCSMEAAAITEFSENTFALGRVQLLKSVVVYGANASGKSNFIRAFGTMRHIIQSSAKMASTDTFEVMPFLLSTETENAPTFFEVVFFVDGIRYRYGFELSQDRIHSEWLFSANIKAEKSLFIRAGDAIEVSKYFPEGKNLEKKTRENALFLPVADQFNGPVAKSIMAWLNRFNTLSGLRHEHYRMLTFRMLNDDAYRPALIDFMKKLDLGFDEVVVSESPFEETDLPNKLPPHLKQLFTTGLEGRIKLSAKTRHDVWDSDGNQVRHHYFDLDSQESAGTNKVFDLLGPVFDTLSKGGILVIDELNAKFHPLITKGLVDLFNSTENNRHNAQLIFATHDTNLLSYGHFRRDQIYFLEKDRSGATDLYSLLEYKEDGETIRKDRPFEKDYIQGKYGAIPYLGNLSEPLSEWQEKQKSTMP